MFFLPHHCLVCDVRGTALCSTCIATLPEPPRLATPSGLDGFTALLSYDGSGRRLVAELKFRGRRGVVPWLAATLVLGLPDAEFDAVTWVPASRAGRRARGVDIGRLLALAVARQLHVPARRLLVRDRSASQASKSAAGRARGPNLRATASAVDHLRVLVIDDVCTTGSSMSAASRELRAHGVEVVHGASVARTPLYGDGVFVGAAGPEGDAPTDLAPGAAPGVEGGGRGSERNEPRVSRVA